jgi:hypothetical protein
VDGSHTDLRQVLVAAPDEPTWQLRVPGFSTPAVSLDPKSKRWRLARRAGVDALEAHDGVIGTVEINRHRWSVPDSHASPFMPIALSGDRALAIEPRLDLALPIADPFGALLFAFASAPRWRSTIWTLGPDGARELGTSRLQVECRLPSVGDRGACQIFDASRTRFFAMGPVTGAIEAIGSLPGRFFASEDRQGGWIVGWYQSSPLAVHLTAAEAIRIADSHGARAHMLAASEHAVAGVWHQIPASAGMRVEPIYQATGTSLVRVYSIY